MFSYNFVTAQGCSSKPEAPSPKMDALTGQPKGHHTGLVASALNTRSLHYEEMPFPVLFEKKKKKNENRTRMRQEWKSTSGMNKHNVQICKRQGEHFHWST